MIRFISLRFYSLRRVTSPFNCIALLILNVILLNSCTGKGEFQNESGWELSIVPSSVRVDPVRNEIIENRFHGVSEEQKQVKLNDNWVFDGERATLYAARGEYVSFQLVLTKNESNLDNINVQMTSFEKGDHQFPVQPELFLEWSVHVKTTSTGYPKSTLGTGWYPDALIPLDCIQYDTSRLRGRWVYPLDLPDFNNRIDDQKSLIIWVDQFVPFDKEEAEAGLYRSEISIQIDGETKNIPIELNVWNFAIPNENQLRAALQHEGFVSTADESLGLEVYQLLKRNRVSVMDPTYKPELNVSKNGDVTIDWNSFDKRLSRFFNGEAFTSKYGYNYGPGYGEPIENFILPFDVYGKYGTRGWPDTGTPDEEKDPENLQIYINTIKAFREHLLKMVDPEKTELTVYLNGLDESYFQEAWNRMIFYGDLFTKYFPEINFRIDGAYPDSAMNLLVKSIDAWGSHTLNYNIEDIKKHRQTGLKDWLYGPLIYEGPVNSWVGSSTFIDLPLVNERGISWACFKYETHSWLSWGIGASWKAAWYDPETWKDKYINGAESDPEFKYKKLNGSGMMIYAPGVVANVDVVCPSIRLKNMRNGIQEYEYFRMLKEAEGTGDQVLAKLGKIIKEPFGKNAIGNTDIWSFNTREWDELRIEAGMLIDSISIDD